MAVRTKPITVRNPQANTIIERVRQVLENTIRTFELEEQVVDCYDTFTGLLNAWPTLINYDQGSEFKGHEFKNTMEED